MNQQDTDTQSIIIEDLAAQFADLPVEDEEQDAIKGGRPDGGPGTGGPVFNHNETTASDESEAEIETLDDLPVEDDEQVKGGPGGWGAGGGVLLNHNETTAADNEDNDAETAQVIDLAVNEAQSEEVKGGMKGDFSRGHQPDLKR